jgi:hypothetical protein
MLLNGVLRKQSPLDWLMCGCVRLYSPSAYFGGVVLGVVVGEEVAVTVGVPVRVAVAALVARRVGVIDRVGVRDGVSDRVGVSEGVSDRVGVAVAVFVGVAVQNFTGQAVGVPVAVGVQVSGMVAVGLWVGVAVATLVRPALPRNKITAIAAIATPPPMVMIDCRVRGCSRVRRLMRGFDRRRPRGAVARCGSIG